MAPGSGGRAAGGSPGAGGSTDAGVPPGCPAGCRFALEESVCGQVLPPPAAVICDGQADSAPLLAAGCLIFPGTDGGGGGLVAYCCPVSMGNQCALQGTGGATGSGGTTGTGGSSDAAGPQSCAPGCHPVTQELPICYVATAQATWMCDQADADPSVLLAGGCMEGRLDASVVAGLYCCTPEFSNQCWQ
jgi:hypothetical protein